MNSENNASIADVSVERSGNLPERPEERMWTMRDAFAAAPGTMFDLETQELGVERGIRSVAFLLKYMSEDGNEEIEGYVAQGLGLCLDFCADQADRVREGRKFREQQKNKQ
ncbi:MAG TPA: hypothetical protein VN881_09540 [Candidatus Acidoferrales bacterium]|nr:hypothetical protein [Candidatus Acidoferrales bacterium]